MNEEPKRRIPLVVKLAYTVFVAVLVPYYWQAYGPTNFLYFCDVALFFTLAAMWLESPLLASAPAVGIVLPQVLWQIDFLGGAVGQFPIGLTTYMFDANLPLFTRGLSFFHFWLPLVLVWMVWQLGYDRRALAVWTGLACVLILVCYLCLPGPPAPAGNPNLPINVNYVYGFSTEGPQTWMPPHLWVAALIVGLPLLVFWPTHVVLNRLFGHGDPARSSDREPSAVPVHSA